RPPLLPNPFAGPMPGPDRPRNRSSSRPRRRGSCWAGASTSRRGDTLARRAELADTSRMSPAEPLDSKARAPEGRDKRRDIRYPIRLHLRLRTVQQLFDLYTKDVSKGGVFVPTSHHVPIGTEVQISMIHPKTEHSFDLEAVVRRRTTGDNAGIGLEFVRLTDA